MKIPAITRLLVLLCLFADPSNAFVQEATAPTLRSFLGWMPMQPVTAGGRLLLDMHRFYFSKPGAGDELILPDAEPGKFNTRFDVASFSLGVQLDPEVSGLLEIPIRIVERGKTDVDEIGRKDTTTIVNPEEGDDAPVLEGVLLIGVQPADGYTFTYRPTDPNVKKVAVAGQFNGWNTESHQLQPAANGTYELFVRLPPGSDNYKLVVDGVWTIDPANTEKSDDGTGNANSVARVGAPDRGQPPVVFASSADGDKAVFRIVRGGSDITQTSAVAQLPDGNSRIAGHELSGDTVTVDTAG